MANERIKPTYEIWKNLGETPLEALSRLRVEENIPAEMPMTYAGRLDPAAEGVLIILTGEECKKKEEYTRLYKTYIAEFLFGISTDTYDLLGLPTAEIEHSLKKGVPKTFAKVFGGARPVGLASPFLSECSISAVTSYLDEHLGTQMQEYPAYSSKAIDTGVIPPSHEVELLSYSDIKMGERSREEVLERVQKLTEIVTGDFRQKEILSAWKDLSFSESLPVITVTLKVSSGFYIRQLAEDVGRALGGGACLYSLIRTAIEDTKIPVQF